MSTGLSPEPGRAEHLQSRAAEVDELVRQGFAEKLAPVFPQGLALVAVGGYGRRELFPSSDIDLLLLRDAEPTPPQREAISRFLGSLWDHQLRVSQSVRPVSECLQLIEGNVELAISLLDHRFLTGDSAVYEQFTSAWPAFLEKHRRAIMDRVVRMTRSRHAKYHETIYHLEPDVKDGPGGLRDLHVLRWLQLLRNTAAPDSQGRAQEFLFGVRSFLHQRQKRDSNILTFELQDRLTEDLGFADPAEMMRGYFRQARAVFGPLRKELDQLESSSGTLVDRLRDWRARLSNSEFTVSRDRIYLRSPQRLTSEPAMLFRLFAFVARHGLALAPDTEQRVKRDAVLPAKVTWSEHIEPILALPYAVMAIRAMQEVGLWTKLLPEWSGIDCLVVRDFYHRYTVDEHTLVTLESLDNLRDEKVASRRLRSLLTEIDTLPALRAALLLHDIGKGRGAESHAEESERIAAEVLERWDAPNDVRSLVLFLVEHHLELSGVMSSRNLDDPTTVHQVAERIGTIERLKNLTLLTFADISAVNPGAMTPWRREQLWHAYTATNRELTRELDTDRIAGDASPALAAFLTGFPTRYQRTHTADEIARHQKLAAESLQKGVALDLTKTRGGYHLTLATHDRPALLAAVAGALASFGLNIIKAEAFANQQGLVLDSFFFADPMRTLELNPPEMDRLRSTLEQAVLGRLSVEKLLRGRAAPKKLPSTIEPAVTLDQQASETSTLVEIVAADRPGLLYDLASAVAEVGCSIEVVLLNTEAHRALDVLYLTENGCKVSEATAAGLREKLYAVCR